MIEETLKAIEERAGAMAQIGYPEAAQRDEMDVVFKSDVPALVAEVRRLRALCADFGHDENCPKVAKGEAKCWCLDLPGDEA